MKAYDYFFNVHNLSTWFTSFSDYKCIFLNFLRHISMHIFPFFKAYMNTYVSLF